jgi:hypothetical protein
MIKKFGNLLFILLFVLSLSACKDDDEPDVVDKDPGTYEVTVTGDTEGKFSGMALFSHGVDPDTDTEIFALMLSPTSQQGITILFAKSGSRPAKGTYPIKLLDIDWDDDDDDDWEFISTDFVAWAFKGSEVEGGEWYFSKSGSITFNTSTPEKMSGGFDLSAMGIKISDEFEFEEIEAQFKGSFNAIYIDPNDFDLGSKPFRFDLN